MKFLRAILTVLMLTAMSVSANWSPVWTDILNTNPVINSTNIVIMALDILAAETERCKTTWTLGRLDTNQYATPYIVSPPSYSYSIQVSTGLYTASVTTQVVIQSGVTNIYLLTNQVLGYRPIACTNMTCYDTTNGFGVFTNSYVPYGLMLQLQQKAVSLMRYFLVTQCVDYVNFYNSSRGTNTYAEDVWGLFNYPPVWAYDDNNTNWMRALGVGSDRMYVLNYANASSNRSGALTAQETRLWTNPVVLAEVYFYVTNTYVENNLVYQQLGWRWVDRDAIPIENLDVTQWSNYNTCGMAYRYVNPNTNAGGFSTLLSIGGLEKHWISAANPENGLTNQPYQKAFTDSFNYGVAAGTTLRVQRIDAYNAYDVTSITSTFQKTELVDGPSLAGAVAQIVWTNPITYYGNQPYTPTIKNLKEYYVMLNAMRFTTPHQRVAFNDSYDYGTNHITYGSNGGGFDPCTNTLSGAEDGATAAYALQASGFGYGLGAYSLITKDICSPCYATELVHYQSDVRAFGIAPESTNKSVTFYATFIPVGEFDDFGDDAVQGINLLGSGQTYDGTNWFSPVFGNAATQPSFPSEPSGTNCFTYYSSYKGYALKQFGIRAIVDWSFEYRNW